MGTFAIKICSEKRRDISSYIDGNLVNHEASILSSNKHFIELASAARGRADVYFSGAMHTIYYNKELGRIILSVTLSRSEGFSRMINREMTMKISFLSGKMAEAVELMCNRDEPGKLIYDSMNRAYPEEETSLGFRRVYEDIAQHEYRIQISMGKQTFGYVKSDMDKTLEAAEKELGARVSFTHLSGSATLKANMYGDNARNAVIVKLNEIAAKIGNSSITFSGLLR